MKKKIIFISQALWLGGIETALVNLLNHLDYNKYDITCLITEDYQNMAGEITSRCRLMVADRQHAVTFKEPYKHRKLFNLMEEPQNDSKIRRLVWKIICFLCRGVEVKLYSDYIGRQLQGEYFDTVIIYSDRVAEIAVRAINADRFLMFYHNADLGRAYHDVFGYCASEKIIAVSEAQCEKLKKVRPYFASKMIAIQNYIDVESTRKKSMDLSESPFFYEKGIHLVSCGRLAYQKGFDIAIEACNDIIKEGFRNVYWYVLGVGSEREELEKLIQKYKLEEHFRLIGAKSNPFPYMKAADLYIQPSRSEGYSLSILEARVLACPIVATFAAAGEQLNNGVTGTLCGTSAADISKAIVKHLQNPDISKQYHKNLVKFDFGKVNDRILEDIENLL